MTPKERVLAAINHRKPDRVPIQIYLTPEMHEKLANHFGTQDVLDVLGVDFRGVHPVYKGAEIPVPEGCDLVDEWGIGYKMIGHGTGAYPEAWHLPFKDMRTMDEVEEHIWPDPDWWDYSTVEAQCDALADYAVYTGSAGIPDILNGVSRARGMEQVMTDIMMEDPVGVAIIDKRCDFYYEQMRRTLEAGNGKIDILCLGEDTGNQLGPMFPPDVFERFFRPRIEPYIKLAHEFGAKAMMHSCGSTRALQPIFIDMGLDVLDAVQPEPVGNNPDEVKAEFGDKLAYCGMISTQQTLPFKSEADCRAEARHRIDVIGADGGYIFSPAHAIQPDTPLENVLAVYEEALGLEPGGLIDKKAVAT